MWVTAEARGRARLWRPGRRSEHRAYPGVARASQETPPGLERTAVPGHLVLRHREGHGPCRFGGLSRGPAIAVPNGRPVPGLGCGNWLATGEGVSLTRP